MCWFNFIKQKDKGAYYMKQKEKKIVLPKSIWRENCTTTILFRVIGVYDIEKKPNSMGN